MNRLIFAVMALTISITTSCSKMGKHVPTCDGSSPTYDAGIGTILQDNCFSCHSAGSGQTVFTSYESMKYSFDNGSFESEVLTKQKMPEGKKLSDSQLDLIKCWVENGYPKN